MKEQIMKLPIGVRLLAPVFAIGLCFGVSIGLYIGWIALPLQIGNVDISDLKGSAQDDYIVLVAKTYSYDHDLDRARERLAQLKDQQIAERVASVALKYASQNKTESTQIAALAVALGSTDDAVALIAMTPSAPIAIAVTPTATATSITPTPSPTVTLTTTSVGTSTRTPTRRPAGTTITAPSSTLTLKTATPAAAILPIAWLPDYPKEWPGGVYLQPANVAPGQKFWHLARALYCDLEDARNDCKNLPGGDHGIGVWIRLVDGYAPVMLDGIVQNLPDKSSDSQCQCTFVLDFPDGRGIQIANFSSDKIGGLALSSVKTQIPQTHVRYFLTFQLMTR